ncbi:MAG: transglutaminase domain-containing protein [Lachnospiraceae bacterium]|nr:transglutaminase domain-containing protein [Lachnospiraceae bacterium]
MTKGWKAATGIVIIALLVVELSMVFSQRSMPFKEGAEPAAPRGAPNTISQTAATERSDLFTYVDSLRDHTPPVFSGVQDRVVTVGSTVLYKEGVTAYDDFDGEIRFTVDISEVNENEAGTYTVSYLATDSSGNEVQETAEFTFVKPDGDMQAISWKNSGFDKDELPILVESIYAGICTENMTDEEKIWTIYHWIQEHIIYQLEFNEHEDLELEAVAGLHRRWGDCFTHAALATVMLNRVGCDTLLVERKSSYGYGEHYWIMFQFEGEWYHMDASPVGKRGYGHDICFFTDQQLMEWSEKHYWYYEWDLDAYPRTPGEIESKYLWFGE